LNGCTHYLSDNAYVGELIAKELKNVVMVLYYNMNNRAYRNRALTSEEKTNRERSRIRAIVEHIFSWMKMLFKKTKVQSICLKQVRNEIMGRNLLYNTHRYICFKGLISS
jgi:uncharacterized membrane-anchored protein